MVGCMKIVAIETYIAGNPWKNWLFAKVTTDEGLYGIGEGTLNYFAKTIETAIHELKPFVIGMDPFQVEIISQRLIRDVYSEGGQVHMCAVAAIEIATAIAFRGAAGGRMAARATRTWANRSPPTPARISIPGTSSVSIRNFRVGNASACPPFYLFYLVF